MGSAASKDDSNAQNQWAFGSVASVEMVWGYCQQVSFLWQPQDSSPKKPVSPNQEI
jgi:hypothetical protein